MLKTKLMNQRRVSCLALNHIENTKTKLIQNRIIRCDSQPNGIQLVHGIANYSTANPVAGGAPCLFLIWATRLSYLLIPFSPTFSHPGTGQLNRSARCITSQCRFSACLVLNGVSRVQSGALQVQELRAHVCGPLLSISHVKNKHWERVQTCYQGILMIHKRLCHWEALRWLGCRPPQSGKGGNCWQIDWHDLHMSRG